MLDRMFYVIASKRADTRLPAPDLIANVRCKKQTKEALLLNISSHGLRFKSDTEYKLGEKLWFDIKSKEEKPTLSVSIKGKIINNYGSCEDGLSDYGVSFYRFRFMNESEHIHYYVHTHAIKI